MTNSPDSFYRFKEFYLTRGDLALREISRKSPMLENRVSLEIEDAVEFPTYSQLRASNELKKKNSLEQNRDTSFLLFRFTEYLLPRYSMVWTDLCIH